MTTIAVGIIALLVVGLLVVVVAALGRSGRPIDIPASAVLRAYLYLASFGGVVVFAIGLIALLNAGIAGVAGGQLAYGGPSDLGRPLASFSGLERRRDEDLVRGVTFTLFGALFWLAHWLARNRVSPGDQGALARAYLFVGTVVFGIASLIFLPNGIYQALAGWVFPAPGSFRPGIGDTLTPGLVSLTIWALYFWRAASTSRGPDRRWVGRGGSSGPPAEPSVVGAPIGPGPSSRAAGAAAPLPREDR